MRIGSVEHPCGGQGGKSLRRLDDECQIAVELRSTSSVPTVALQSRLAQDSLDGAHFIPYKSHHKQDTYFINPHSHLLL